MSGQKQALDRKGWRWGCGRVLTADLGAPAARARLRPRLAGAPALVAVVADEADEGVGDADDEATDVAALFLRRPARLVVWLRRAVGVAAATVAGVAAEVVVAVVVEDGGAMAREDG